MKNVRKIVLSLPARCQIWVVIWAIATSQKKVDLFDYLILTSYHKSEMNSQQHEALNFLKFQNHVRRNNFWHDYQMCCTPNLIRTSNFRASLHGAETADQDFTCTLLSTIY